MPYRTVVFLLLLTLLAGCSDDPLMHAADAEPGTIGNLAGSYVLNGIDPFGTEYAGRLDVTAGSSITTYELQWIVPETVQQGTGILNGNTLEVTWLTSDQAALAVSGTAAFTVTVDGELYGAKMVDGDDREWRETAYPINPDDI